MSLYCRCRLNKQPLFHKPNQFITRTQATVHTSYTNTPRLPSGMTAIAPERAKGIYFLGDSSACKNSTAAGREEGSGRQASRQAGKRTDFIHSLNAQLRRSGLRGQWGVSNVSHLVPPNTWRHLWRPQRSLFPDNCPVSVPSVSANCQSTLKRV